MKKSKAVIACVGLLSLCSSSLVFAENREGAFSFELATGYYAFSSKRSLDDVAIPNLQIGYNFDTHWAILFDAGAINTNQKGANLPGVHGWVYILDGAYRFTPHGRFAPYVTAGVGVISLTQNSTDPNAQANINAGLGAQYFMDRSIALDVAAKDLYTMSGGKNDVMLTAGVTFYIGGN